MSLGGGPKHSDHGNCVPVGGEERQRDGPVWTDAKDGELQPQLGDRLGPSEAGMDRQDGSSP